MKAMKGDPPDYGLLRRRGARARFLSPPPPTGPGPTTESRQRRLVGLLVVLTLLLAVAPGDGSHATLAGSYLGALVITATLTGETPLKMTNNLGVDAGTADALREAAAKVSG